ncbi:hypothetical protein Q8A67_007080 [Cirrhinus molitorella]|uniref:Ig-like domain-containing protein n=1 Tax=Cirrhinus molitorella TaxID=172907 RepID=A0AA88QA64_9TELE|nr:hypothetical protein Q8A67_007080 [Cirrhinus molitorella]
MDWLYLRKTALILDMLVVFLLQVSTDAQGNGSQCPVFKVQRGTVHKAYINKPLKISCNLVYCDDQAINVIWTKDNLKERILVNETDQMSTSQSYLSPNPKMLTSYLTFTNILKHHDGLYRCELMVPSYSIYSHSINVSVSDDITEVTMSCTDMTTGKENTDSTSNSYPWWLPYFFICLGVVILVLIVILTSILCNNGFKSSRRKNKQRAKYSATSDFSSPRPSVLKRDEFVCVQYSEEPQQHSRDSNKCNLTLPPEQSTSHMSNCSDDPLSNRRESRSSQVVYASLHHLAPTPSSATPRQTQEEFSEYASIRVS